ncbi:MAG: BlaI/MecI/CopY family transcriptional regulator [Anaerolineae bacterium]|nr:BlaI/MecI/CopY family transcriptional regulator [Anaerolineae bacterium]MDW8070179.1 helix-turn-helix domain-containing protein [Anaerolineae bacterium]
MSENLDDILDRINGLTPEELELLKTVSARGAVTADEVALELDRPGDDLSTLMNGLVEKGLIEAHTVNIEDENFSIYQVDPRIQRSLK